MPPEEAVEATAVLTNAEFYLGKRSPLLSKGKSKDSCLSGTSVLTVFAHLWLRMSRSGSWKFTPKATDLASQLIDSMGWMTWAMGCPGGSGKPRAPDGTQDSRAPGGAEKAGAFVLQATKAGWTAVVTCCP